MGLEVPGQLDLASTPRSISTNSTMVAATSDMDEKPHVDVEDSPDSPSPPLHSNSLDDSFAALSEAEHAARRRHLLRKIDFRLLPTLSLIYFVSFLDKNALSQAKLAHIEKDLKMHGTNFNAATSIYFAGYIIFQPLSNGILTYVRPSLYLPLATLVWGIVAAAQASVRTYHGLLAVRFFLGVAESPVFPGSLFLMSSWYTRSELGHRFAWYFAGQQLASAFGGLIAAGILGNLNGSMGISAWRWLFIIEGAITVCVAIYAIFVLPNFPAGTLWLSESDRAYASWRLKDDTGEEDTTGTFTAWQGFKLLFFDKRVYVFLLLQHSGNLTQAFLYFFPAIVKTLGYSPVATLLITAPVWFATFIVSLIVTYTSGKYGNRTYHIMFLMGVACIGNIIMVSTRNTAARFFAMFLLPMGASSCFQIIVTFVASSFPRPFEKRAQITAWGSVVGNTASMYGSYMYPNSDGPRYLPAAAGMATLTVLVACLAFGIRQWLIGTNRKLENQELVFGKDGRLIKPSKPEEIDASAKGFQYVL